MRNMSKKAVAKRKAKRRRIIISVLINIVTAVMILWGVLLAISAPGIMDLNVTGQGSCSDTEAIMHALFGFVIAGAGYVIRRLYENA